MRSLLLSLLLLTLSVSASDVPLLLVGGDGYAYFISHEEQKPRLFAARQGSRARVGIPPVYGLFPAKTGVFANADEKVWLIEQGQPTKIADGVLVDAATASDGTYLYLWQEQGLSVLFVP